ncbi:ribosomal protein S18 acetylase RimI-like enzyme [Jatrophihabitans sp. GAS493]|uniref:GNAT family N-acetyltransferase n=1 Tax=Jatrophihabitans sp. GAS493 TaxID=1907575 RepID=UPI000BB7579F|nr:GNAT family N-acetyltransferase [Jatrophihabitans sp. GAS493]SOD70971.1 ribosomal protein S18 acetylase RimI-like enzyme [Jatrophihabitans sp. GAS493]
MTDELPVIRPIRPTEIDQILQFWSVAAEDAHRPPDSRDAVERLIVRDHGALLVAVEPDATAGAGAAAGTVTAEIIGSVIAGWDGWRCHIYRLAVAPTRRGAGLGRALLRAAESRFLEFGGTRADAMVLDANTLGQATWSANDYRRQPEWSRWVKPL